MNRHGCLELKMQLKEIYVRQIIRLMILIKSFLSLNAKRE